MQSIRYLYDWMGNQVHARHATKLLGFLFFLEGFIFLPTDPMLVLYCLERRQHAFRFAAIATAASVLGGIVSYIIGYTLWLYAGTAITHNSVVNYLVKPETFNTLCSVFKTHAWFAMLVAGLMPIPYKAATITAGFCAVPLLPFIVCSIITRGLRFFLVAGALRLWGKQVKDYIDRYFNMLVILAVLCCVGALWYMKHKT